VTSTAEVKAIQMCSGRTLLKGLCSDEGENIRENDIRTGAG
jgi:hypothetical protein